MTHDTKYVDTLLSAEQMKKEFVTAKGNGSHTSLLCLLRSAITVGQVERYIEDKVRERYLRPSTSTVGTNYLLMIFSTAVYIRIQR